MKYMKKNLNIFLLFMIVLLLGSFAVFTVYYKNTYKDLASTFFDLKGNYEQTAEELSLRRAQLNVTLEEFELKKTREQSLSEKYSDIRTVNAELTLDLAETRKSLADTEIELENKKQEVEAKNTEIAGLKDDVVEWKSKYESKDEDYDDCCSDISDLGGSC